MSKKNIAISMVLGVASLGLVTSTFANSYNDGYIQAPVPVATASPYADSSFNAAGFVIGLEGGYADTHWDNLAVTHLSISDSGFAGRAFLGYDFNQYFGVESGFIFLPDAKFSVDNIDADAKIRNYAIDLLAKVSVPVTSGFKLYAKAGAGYFNSKLSSSLPGEEGQTNSHVGPAFGVGAGYEVVPNLTINLSWMRYSGHGKVFSDNYQPNPDVVLLGLSYKFPIRS
jgi:opacity protein-like surface antigen